MINNIIVVADTHCGCQMGLCPPKVRLDGGGYYYASPLQLKVWAMWKEFWDGWVKNVTHGEPYAVVFNGDPMDGRHHNSISQLTQNKTIQNRIAYEAIKPIVDKSERFFMIRGTEAHGGQNSEDEEKLAQDLESEPDEQGNYARYELWARAGKGLCHFMHHIGSTGRTHYETSAVMAELAESYTEAGRWRREPPDVVVRSHRHRHIEIRVPTKTGYGISFVTAAWQLKTPFVQKIPGGRVSTPQIGGSLIRQGDQDLYTRHKIWEIERSSEVVI